MKTFFLLLLVSSVCSAQENFAGLVQALDPESQRTIQSYVEDNGLTNVPLDNIEYILNSDKQSLQVLVTGDEQIPDSEKRLLVLLGAGVGLVHTYGVNATIIRKNSNGRLTWFAQTEAGYFELGNAPANISVGFGVFPFKKPTVGLALNVNKSSYSSKLGSGPELSVRKFFGSSQNVSVYSKLGANFYFGEQSASGKSYSVMPNLEFGVAIKILNLKR